MLDFSLGVVTGAAGLYLALLLTALRRAIKERRRAVQQAADLAN